MATIDLGKIKFKWQGAYNGATAYVVDDVVESGGSAYVCIAATTGNTPPNATYWELMSQAGTNGTNGTDLTTTLTTQGDLVYRDGSGLQRLGAGTAGQVLQTNGTGANPSWGTVASDMVRLATVNSTSGVNFSINGYFTSDYDLYKLYGYDWAHSNSRWVKLRVNMNGSTQTGSSYNWTGHYNYGQSGANGSGHETGASQSYIPVSWWGGDSNDTNYTEINIINPLSTSKHKGITVYMGGRDSGNTWYNWHSFGQYETSTTTAVSGVTLFAEDASSTWTQGTWTLYGIKKA